MSSARTLTELLSERAADQSRAAIRFVEGDGRDGREGRVRSVRSLAAAAESFADALDSRGVSQGRPVVIQARSAEATMVALWGSIVAGAVAVPLPLARTQRDRALVSSVLSRLDGPQIAFDAGATEWVSQLDPSIARVAVEWREEASLPRVMKASERRSPGATAWLQFSSGSTGAPRGVVIRDENVLANAAAIARRARLTDADSSLSWLPLFHDMGLVGMHITPLVVAGGQTHAAPEWYLRDPLAWLREAANVRATVLATNQSALALLLRRSEGRSLEGLDLSRVRRVFIGAEPIEPSTIASFVERFAAAGLRADAMYPGYGLAEATLAVTLPEADVEPRVLWVERDSLAVGSSPTHTSAASISAVGRMACGSPVASVELSVRDDHGASVADGVVGHLFVRGASVADAMFDARGATTALATLRESGVSWVPTGDTGWIDRGELFVAGRTKELVFVGGTKVYLSDVEQRIADEIHSDRSRVRVTMDGARMSVALLRSDVKGEVLDAIALRLAAELGLDEVRFESSAALSLTSSGKPSRAHEFKQGVTLAAVLRALASVGITTATAETPLESLGLASLSIVRATERVESELGRRTTPAVWLTAKTVGDVANAIDESALEPNSARPNTGTFSREGRAVVIVAASVSVADCEGIEAFADALFAGRAVMGALPDERRALLEPWVGHGEAQFRRGSWLRHPERFDRERFAMNVHEATALHPAARLLLEACEEVLRECRATADERAACGTFVGHVSNEDVVEWQRMLERSSVPQELGRLLNLGSFYAGFVAHKLGLGAGALTVDTACSSGLVALALAASAIERGECELALCGASRVMALPLAGASMGIESTRGTCLPFSSLADGTLVGEGTVVFALMTEERAKRTGRRILGRLRGWATNHDGRSLTMTAPNPAQQEMVLRRAWERAGIHGDELSFIEAHGSATPLGDPAELDGIRRALADRRPTKSIPIGSVKSNFGHLFEAAGLLGVAKAIVALDRGALPPTLGVDRPIDVSLLDQACVALARETIPLAEERPLVAGVSSFGLSGTNAHVVLERGDPPPKTQIESRIEARSAYWPTPTRRTDGATKVERHTVIARAAVHIEAMTGRAVALDEQTDLFAIGLDSLELVQLRTQLEREFSVSLGDLSLSTSNVGVIAALVVERALGRDQRDARERVPASPRPGDVHSSERAAAWEPPSDAERAIEAAFIAETNQSKLHQTRVRKSLANNRAVAGLRPATKESAYPIAYARGVVGHGARFVDADGRTMIDLCMGFGTALFGHQPTFVEAAIREALDRRMVLGPMSMDAGLLAEKLCAMTSCDRAAFFNSGTEAVMVALRLARATTERRLVAMFRGSYHGTFDGVLAVPGRASPPVPVRGTPPAMLEDVVFLDYGTDEALAWIEAHANELAAVLVEPVQSRRPSLQPIAFLHAIRAATERAGAALIFDEVITGFRCHAGGAQARFGVRADLCTYGKVLGGGLPIGVVAGRERFLDAIDGGQWTYGDDSLPQVATTFVAGTFCHHPLAMRAALAILDEIESRGPSLQATLDAKTEALCDRVDRALAARGVARTCERFSSLFRLPFDGRAEIAWSELARRGVYAWEGRTCFLSTEHREDDIDAVAEAIEATIELMAPSRSRSASTIAGRRELSPERRSASTLLCVVACEGALDLARLRAAHEAVATRHPSLRTVLSSDGSVSSGDGMPPLHCTDVASDEASDQRIERWLLREVIDREPACALHVHTLAEKQHRLVLAAHRDALDGRSLALWLDELARVYSRGEDGLSPAGESLAARRAREGVARREASSDGVPARVRVVRLTAGQLERASATAAFERCSLFVWLLKATTSVLRRRGAAECAMGVPVAREPVPAARLVSFTDVARLDGLSVTREATVADCARAVSAAIGSVSEPNDLKNDGPIEYVCNIDRVRSLPVFEGLSGSWVAPVATHTRYALVVDLVVAGDSAWLVTKTRAGHALDEQRVVEELVEELVREESCGSA